jgi:hypothetical protein
VINAIQKFRSSRAENDLDELCSPKCQKNFFVLNAIGACTYKIEGFRKRRKDNLGKNHHLPFG